MSSHKLEASLFYFEWAISWRVSWATASTRPSSTKHGQPTGPIQKPIHLKAHLLFFARRSPYFLKRGRSQENPPSSSLPLTLPSRPNPPAPHLPHSYRKPPLTFFLTHTENTCSSFSTPTENPSSPSSSLLQKNQLPFFFACTTTRLVIRYTAQIRERDATPSRKMESAHPSAKKMRLPPAATVDVKTGRSRVGGPELCI